MDGGRAGHAEATLLSGHPLIKRTLEWAVLKLTSEAVVTRKAPRMVCVMLVAMELLVADSSAPVALRIGAWLRLLKVYGTLRWDDLQRVRPEQLEMRTYGLVGRLLRTKTIGVGRRLKELPLFVPLEADLSGAGWLHTFFFCPGGGVGSAGSRFLLAEALARFLRVLPESGGSGRRSSAR